MQADIYFIGCSYELVGKTRSTAGTEYDSGLSEGDIASSFHQLA
jgi:hypothetical protein